MRLMTFLISAVLLIGCAVSVPARAEQALAKPFGKIILTVDGSIGIKNLGNQAVFDSKMLADLDTYTIRTATPWDVGVSDFTGCRLSRLVAAVGATADRMIVTALDGYQIEIPLSDVTDYDPILAWGRDGDTMSVRDKGPLWVIYPFDSHSALKGMKYSARSVWQVERISFR